MPSTHALAVALALMLAHMVLALALAHAKAPRLSNDCKIPHPVPNSRI